MRQLSCSLNFTKVLSRAIHDLSWAHIAIFLHFELDQTSLWEISWSSGTLVIHHAHSSIKSIKSGSSEALHSPEKKQRKEKKRKVSEDSYLSQKKKRTKGKDGEAKIKHHSKDIYPSHTCTWPSSKVTWPIKD